MKFMMGKVDELSHIPPMVHDTLKKLRDEKTEGSNHKLADLITQSFLSKLNSDTCKETIHEGFDPVLNLEEVLGGHCRILMDKFFAAPRE